MKINKQCPCGERLTTSKVVKLAKTKCEMGKILWMNCKTCNSTLVLKLKQKAA